MSTWAPRILLVEDNEDIREGLAAMLEGEGYSVIPVGTAEDGLRVISGGNVHLLITDYMLPNHTGAWLIDQARAKNYLNGTPAMVITAHPGAVATEGAKVLKKPLDIDAFLKVVHELTAKAREEAAERTKESLRDRSKEVDAARCELRLYISSGTSSSLRALRNLHKLLDAYPPNQVKLTVHDLAQDPLQAAEEDKISFTPTLVKRAPGARAWILGDLENAKPLHDLLALAGVKP